MRKGAHDTCGPQAKQADRHAYRILANSGKAAHQAVPHFHLHLFGGRDLGGRLLQRS